MLPSAVCFSCGAQVQYSVYQAALRRGQTRAEALAAARARLCCRTMLLTAVDLLTPALERAAVAQPQRQGAAPRRPR